MLHLVETERLHDIMESHDYQDYFYPSDESNLYAEPEFYVDQFYSQDQFGGYDEDEIVEGLSPFSLMEVVEHCVQPTIIDGFKHISKILTWSLIFRVLSQVAPASILPDWTRHAASIVCGTVLSYLFFSSSVMYLVTLVIFTYLVLLLTPGIRGPVIAAIVISFNIGCESFLSDPVSWHQVRGAIMIASMKIISVGFDVDAGEKEAMEAKSLDAKKEDKESEVITKSEPGRYNLRNRKQAKSGDTKDQSPRQEQTSSSQNKPGSNNLDSLPGFLPFAGYCMCPGTVVLGPWLSFSDYNNIFINPRWSFTWLIKILGSITFAFIFLTISTCWNPWLIPDSDWIWLIAYRDAVSFRASHYFVSFMSEASAVASGFGAIQENDELKWHMEVSQPHNIEVPRSLVEVVVSWNLPMHAWLKKYVFKQARKNFGSGVAVLATYCASTLLHGMSAQLAAVLFSLGLYTWVEHSFRKKLAKILNASIETKSDKSGKYRYGERSVFVILINIGFCVLTMFHLAYLGVMFDQSDSSSSGYSWHHTLHKWSNLGFRSHFVVLAMMVLNWFL